jgi:ATP-binding cassette, subfamily C, bacterial
MKQIPIVQSTIKNLNPMQEALQKCKNAFWIVFWFALCVNLLMLITPLYSLQVLDRVIGSGNLSTLLMLSLIIGLIYFVYGLVQIARSFLLIKMGEWLDNTVSPILFAHSVASSAIKQTLGADQLLRDFQTVKTFVTSTGINTIFDAPWTLAYLAVIFMINPYIGYLTVVGGIVIIIFAFLNAIATNQTLGEATEYSIKGLNQAQIATRNAEVIEAMGMMKNVMHNWKKFNTAALTKQSIASYRNGVISNISRYIRNVMQMMVTGIGAYVVVISGGKDMTTGGMIASSILVGKALAPFDNFIELWKSISSTLKSYKRINESFKINSLRDDAMPIPDVSGHLTVDNIYYAHAPSGHLAFFSMPKYIIKGVSFSVQPGEVLAIIGPSGAGKSTLSKLIVGVWKTTSGTVRLDGGEIYRWNREDFGKHVGYLPQGIELFSGTIKQNIARMEEEVDPEKVIEAAKMAGAHEIILKFPDGYDSDIGIAGSNLSGGQRQRIGLARAFYKNPKIVILDEPNANLDEAGEKALSGALVKAKEKKMAVVVISHRPSVLNVADHIIVIQDGAVAAYGTKDEIHSKVQMLNDGIIHIEQ